MAEGMNLGVACSGEMVCANSRAASEVIVESAMIWRMYTILTWYRQHCHLRITPADGLRPDKETK